jgi:hypothetical protein
MSSVLAALHGLAGISPQRTPRRAGERRMTGYELLTSLGAYRAARRRAAQRTVVLIVATLSPWVAIGLAVRYLW